MANEPLTFESPEAKEIIHAKGLSQLKSKKVSKRALILGEKYLHPIESGYLPKVSVRWIHEEIGHGLFAEEALPKGIYAGEYTGLVRENNRRYFEPLNNYCYEYPVPDEIGRSYVIDATCGNLTRFINHSDKPNLKPVYAFYDGFFHLIFLTLKKIPIGEQLSYDYGESYWYLRDRPVIFS